MIELEKNITDNEKLALIECITNSIQHATVEMEEVCYFAGFRPENLNLVSQDKVERQLQDMGYTYDEDIKKWKKITMEDSIAAQYEKQPQVLPVQTQNS